MCSWAQPPSFNPKRQQTGCSHAAVAMLCFMPTAKLIIPASFFGQYHCQLWAVQENMCNACSCSIYRAKTEGGEASYHLLTTYQKLSIKLKLYRKQLFSVCPYGDQHLTMQKNAGHWIQPYNYMVEYVDFFFKHKLYLPINKSHRAKWLWDSKKVRFQRIILSKSMKQLYIYIDCYLLLLANTLIQNLMAIWS